MKKVIRLTESDLTKIVKRVISEQSKKGQNSLTPMYDERRKRRGYDTPIDIEERLIILYLMDSRGKNKLGAIKELSGINYESIQDKESEEIMDWLESIGLDREDIYVDTDNESKVLNKVKTLELLESTMGNVKPLISEGNPPNGYVDITSWFITPEGQIFLPDGEYSIEQDQVCNDKNCIFTIEKNDMTQTGYAIGPDFDIASKYRTIPYKVKISQKGMAIQYEISDNLKIYLNQSVLDSSGLSTKKK
jgi:hypothetical protein